MANILKDAKNLRKDYEFFKILYNWYGKCTSANIFQDGPLAKEEAMEIKKRLGKEELSEFTMTNEWLERWKSTYGVKEMRLCGEADEISTTTVEVWIERLPELCHEYEPQNILILDELGLFFKAFSEKGLVVKSKKQKGGKDSKQRMTAMFIVATDGSFVSDHIFIGRAKSPR